MTTPEKNKLTARRLTVILQQLTEAGRGLLGQRFPLDWTHWSGNEILGLRSLQVAQAYARAGSTNMRSQAYRDAISYLLTLRKYHVR